jgi:uncharacterized protein YlxW (UPF0749 family)
MDSDLTKSITERVALLQNERNALQQRLNQLNSLQSEVTTKMVELQGAIRELEIVIGKRDLNGQPVPVVNVPVKTEKTEINSN